MATCQGTYGEGWSGKYPDCQYSPHDSRVMSSDQRGLMYGDERWWSGKDEQGKDFHGRVDYLDFGEDFKGTTLEGLRGDEWKQYFDPYDVTAEVRAKEQTSINIGQLEKDWALEASQNLEDWQFAQEDYARQGRDEMSLWDVTRGDLEAQIEESQTLWGMQKGELERQQESKARQQTEAQTGFGIGEAGRGRRTQEARATTGLEMSELGAQARTALQQAKRQGKAARKKSGLAFSGTAAGMEREARGATEGAYQRGMRGGRTRLGAALGGIGQERVESKEALSQTLAGLTSDIEGLGFQITEGAEIAGQAQAQLGRDIGEERTKFEIELGDLGYTLDDSGNLVSTGLGDLGTQQNIYTQAMETGVHDLQQDIIDQGQALKDKTWNLRDSWVDQMESQKASLLAPDSDVWLPEGTTYKDWYYDPEGGGNIKWNYGPSFDHEGNCIANCLFEGVTYETRAQWDAQRS